MALFLSTYEKKIDRKGRVSVPAPFRAVLANEAYSGVAAYASFVHPCIEACGMGRLEAISRRIEALDPYSEERDAFALAILGGAEQLPFDSEGRIVLPERILEQAGVTEGEVAFVGKGATFEIWHPARLAEQVRQARKVALEKRGDLRGEQR